LMALKNVLRYVMLLCLIATSTATRDVPIEPGYFKGVRLEDSGGLVECWNALMELKSCTNEIVLFFINGQATIGPDCCGAIGTITRRCWPTILTSLGFTAEEGNILRGYCDASFGPAAAPLAALTVQSELLHT
ncbi:Prolamin_like domain-containing protein, partial [Cephalotus follicularis]